MPPQMYNAQQSNPYQPSISMSVRPHEPGMQPYGFDTPVTVDAGYSQDDFFG